jgi:uncharacterized sodium:solute symporter family permease YidK
MFMMEIWFFSVFLFGAIVALYDSHLNSENKYFNSAAFLAWFKQGVEKLILFFKMRIVSANCVHLLSMGILNTKRPRDEFSPSRRRFPVLSPAYMA